jgi:Ni,Fe-hydrogenase III component G
METRNDPLEIAENLLAPWAARMNRPEDNRLDVYLERENFKAAAQAVYRSSWGYLAAITGLDLPPTAENGVEPEGHIEVLYHFCRNAAVLTLRIRLPYADPTIETVCDLSPSATLYERELMELFGVEISGTPNTDRLVLPDDWPDGVYPLRKSFAGLPNGV